MELLIVLLLFLFVVYGAPFVLIWKVAESRNRSAAYCWWVLLGWIGAVIAMAIILVQSEKPAPPAAPAAVEPSGTTGQGDGDAIRRHRNGKHDRLRDPRCPLC